MIHQLTKRMKVFSLVIVKRIFQDIICMQLILLGIATGCLVLVHILNSDLSYHQNHQFYAIHLMVRFIMDNTGIQ